MNTKYKAAIAAFFTILSFKVLAGPITQTPAWPSFEEYAFNDQAFHRTHSLLIVRDGKVIYERFRPGFTERTPQQLWSISKSVSGLIIGLAIEDKLLKSEDPLNKYYPKAPAEVQLQHLLNMTSGLEWNEGYEYNPVKSDVIRMLYTANFDDMAAFAANKPSDHQPGSNFKYSSGNTNILMGVLAKVTGPGDYAEYPWRRLFNPLNITSATWERDQRGTFVGSSYLYMSARDLAKIGELFLTNGMYQGKQIVPAAWLERSKKAAPFFSSPVAQGKVDNEYAYSHQWWLNKPLIQSDGSSKRKFPDLPEDTIFALGHWGQMLVVIPSLKLVMVRTGADKTTEGLDRNKFFSLFMRALKQAP